MRPRPSLLLALLLFSSTLFIATASTPCAGQTLSPQKQSLLKVKAELLKELRVYDEEESNARSTLRRAESMRQEALKQRDGENAELAQQAIDLANQAVRNARRNRSEDQIRLDAINRALEWPDTGKFVAVGLMMRGTVRRQIGESWIPFDPTVPLKIGEQVRLEANSFLEILFEDGSRIDLGPNSEFQYSPDKESEQDWLYDLKSGILHLLHSCGPSPGETCTEGKRYRLPAAILAVRGSEFFLEVTSGANVIAVLDGWVEVEVSNSRQKIAVHAGERLQISEDGAVDKPTSFDPLKATRWWE